MPDSDIIRHGLARRYNQPYKQICEAVADNAVISGGLVRKALAFYCKKPEFGRLVRALNGVLQNHSGPWDDAYSKRDSLCRQGMVDLNKQIVNIVKDAFDLCLQQRREQRGFASQVDLPGAIAARIFAHDVAAPIAANVEPHFGGAEHSDVQANVDALQPIVVSQIQVAIRKVIGGDQLRAVRIPTRRPRTMISAETDFMSLLSKPNANGIQPELPL